MPLMEEVQLRTRGGTLRGAEDAERKEEDCQVLDERGHHGG